MHLRPACRLWKVYCSPPSYTNQQDLQTGSTGQHDAGHTPLTPPFADLCGLHVGEEGLHPTNFPQKPVNTVTYCGEGHGSKDGPPSQYKVVEVRMSLPPVSNMHNPSLKWLRCSIYTLYWTPHSSLSMRTSSCGLTGVTSCVL